VNIKFADKFLNEEMEVAEVADTMPPPPTVPDNIPPPPPIKTFSAPTKPVEPRDKEGFTAQEALDKDKAIHKELDEAFAEEEVDEALEEIKEIAKASPNVIIATIPKDEEEEEAEWPAFVKSRAGNLIATAKWKAIGGDIIRHESGKTLHYQDLDDMDNDTYTDALKEAQGTKTALPTAEVIKAQQERAKADREKVLNDLGLKRIAILVKNGCEEHLDSEGTLAGIDCPDGEAYGIERIGKMDNEEWMPMTVKYSAKKVADMHLAKAEAEMKAKATVAPDKDSTSTVDAYESSKARRQALYALGWKDDPKYKKYVAGPDGQGFTYDEILNMPEAGFKKLIAIPVAKEVEVPKAEIEKVDMKAIKNLEVKAEKVLEELETEAAAKKAKAEHDAALEAKMDALDEPDDEAPVEEWEENPIAVEEEPVVSKKEIAEKPGDLPDDLDAGYNTKEEVKETLAQELLKSRDEIAFAVMLQLVSPSSKKGAESIAKFAYDLADAMLTQKLK